jgi:hypothetical protein
MTKQHTQRVRVGEGAWLQCRNVFFIVGHLAPLNGASVNLFFLSVLANALQSEKGRTSYLNNKYYVFKQLSSLILCSDSPKVREKAKSLWNTLNPSPSSLPKQTIQAEEEFLQPCC